MTRSLELPVALLAFGLFLAVAFQTIELVRDSENLRAIEAGQDAPLEEATRLKQAADSLAGDIAALAQQGDANARQVVDELAHQNVQLRPSMPAGLPK
jgi:hypothetical protein